MCGLCECGCQRARVVKVGVLALHATCTSAHPVETKSTLKLVKATRRDPKA